MGFIDRLRMKNWIARKEAMQRSNDGAALEKIVGFNHAK
jgi:hypothetical protein